MWFQENERIILQYKQPEYLNRLRTRTVATQPDRLPKWSHHTIPVSYVYGLVEWRAMSVRRLTSKKRASKAAQPD